MEAEISSKIGVDKSKHTTDRQSYRSGYRPRRVHFMRNIMAYIPHRDKQAFAAELKQIWLAPDAEGALKRAALWQINTRNGFHKPFKSLKVGLKIPSNFMLFRL